MEKEVQILFAELTQGSSEAFEEIYVLFYEASVRFCFSLVKDQAEAEGLVQDVFIQLWERRNRLDSEIEFKSYLFACLKNRAFDKLRAIRKSQEAIENQWKRIEQLQSEVNDELNEQKIDSILMAIEDLPPGRKQIIQLRYLKGKSYKEIAEQLNISSHTVKNQLIKAKQHLKSAVEFQISWFLVVVTYCFF